MLVYCQHTNLITSVQPLKNTLFNDTYTVTSNIDRMGYRLKDKLIEFVEQSFLSDRISLGGYSNTILYE